MSVSRKPWLARLLALAALGASVGFVVPFANAAPAPSTTAPAPTPQPPPYHSRALWATINVCNPKSAPDVVGVRGSMPGTGQSDETMYMRFRLQYMDTATGSWQDLGQGADSGFLAVGDATTTRQTGRSFTLRPSTTDVTLRGVINFQWRHDARVTYATERVTSANHASLAGATPPGFTAATCQFT
jgi:hypothetical protein